MLSPELLAENWVQNTLAAVLFLVTLSISIRAFIIYTKTDSPRVLSLAIAMGVIALTALADFLSSNMTGITLHTDWFLYLGQAASFLFIALSLLRNTNNYFRVLIRAQILTTALLIGLVLLSPTLPDLPFLALRVILSGARIVCCLAIFYFYISAYMAKHTRFSLMMSISFVLLAFGYLVLIQKYFSASGDILDHTGDFIRIAGLIVLFIATLIG